MTNVKSYICLFVLRNRLLH